MARAPVGAAPARVAADPHDVVGPDPAGRGVHRGGPPAVASAVRGGSLLRFEHFREYDHCNGFRPYTKMKYLGDRRWTVPDGTPRLPFMYSVVARKPA